MSSRPQGPHGLLPLDKPGGITSHDLVARTRKALGTRKVGHAGTLDPMATGLMLLGVGDATRLLTYLVGEDKVYEATARFGIATNTEDADGEVTSLATPEQLRSITHDRLEAALEKLRGEIQQVPSAVSAIKVNGVRSYKRVRDGEEVELAARTVTIHELHVLGTEFRELGLADGTTQPVLDVRLRVGCSSGTYVRAIARDLGNDLGVGAHLTALNRLEVGDFRVANATTVSDEQLESRLVSPSKVATTRFPSFVADGAQASALRNGRRIAAPAGTESIDGPIAALDADGDLIGLIEIRDGVSKILMNMPQRSVSGA